MSALRLRPFRTYPQYLLAVFRLPQTRAPRACSLPVRTRQVPQRDTASRSTPSAAAQSSAYRAAPPAALPLALPLRFAPAPFRLLFFQLNECSFARFSRPPCPDAQVAGKLLCFTTEQNLNS